MADKKEKKWEDDYSAIVSKTVKVDGDKEWRFVLEEHRSKGTMQMNVRKWNVPEDSNKYSGPSKNGFIEKVNSIEDIEILEKSFAEFFKEIKKML